MSIYDTKNSFSIIPKFCKCDSSISSTAAWCCNQCGLPTGEDYISNQLALKDGNERLREALKDVRESLCPTEATEDLTDNDVLQFYKGIHKELAKQIDTLLSQSTDKP